jgi:hypothetical protein
VETSNLPAVSPGTAPIDRNGAKSGADPRAATTGSAAADAARTQNARAAESLNSAAHPQTPASIGTASTVVVPTPPPSPQIEAAPSSRTNDQGQVWVDGHYSWSGGQWNWVNGSWQRPPNGNGTWIPGSYDRQTKRWTEGHWTTMGPTAPRNRDGER